MTPLDRRWLRLSLMSSVSALMALCSLVLAGQVRRVGPWLLGPAFTLQIIMEATTAVICVAAGALAPFAALLGSTFVFSTDLRVTRQALNSMGASPRRLARGPLLAGLAWSLVTGWLTMSGQPWGADWLLQRLPRVALQNASLLLHRGHAVTAGDVSLRCRGSRCEVRGPSEWALTAAGPAVLRGLASGMEPRRSGAFRLHLGPGTLRWDHGRIEADAWSVRGFRPAEPDPKGVLELRSKSQDKLWSLGHRERKHGAKRWAFTAASGWSPVLALMVVLAFRRPGTQLAVSLMLCLQLQFLMRQGDRWADAGALDPVVGPVIAVLAWGATGLILGLRARRP
ncbi:MAG: hypothetical protein ACFB9M_15405 [Myxococcota bacterium]